MWRILLFTILVGCSYHGTGEYFGANYLGVPYVLDPLGEEVSPDTDPLIRYDAFDCTTFVETVLANNDVNKLNKIRYVGGVPNILNRNHFIETDWLENNSNLVVNVSANYAPTKIRTVTVDKKKWFKTVYDLDTDFTTRTIDLEYIPYTYAHNIKISKPMIVLFIIDNPKIRRKLGTDLAVRHMGFLLPDGRLRHASRSKKQVLDTNFDKYVNRLVENKNNLGIMLLEIKK
ncbi:MAG: DUF1460 domain-containing protein [Alphaproteobacteria bacterium]|nr:DUF1460 domain-containing protein [Alphaproteobacteria bacterium]